MPVTVNINNLTLCHKGSNGISIATIPDVCKTPSPGGPVPIPYPNIAMSSDLMKGTTTVKADGGNMCAKYGSEFFKSTGDEPGVAGGVKSSVFIKEATWITYSFDVKLEGKGACRLTDKMFHNHQNTVNMGGEIQTPLMLKDIILRCEDGWSDCQKKQMRAKAEKMDAIATKKGSFQTRGTKKLSAAKCSWQKKYAKDWNKENPEGWPSFYNPSKQTTHFYDDCAKTSDPLAAKMQADHVQEVQLGGSVKGPFLWLDGAVNGASGRQIYQQSKKNPNPTGFKIENC
jgi:hypothetical protein